MKMNLNDLRLLKVRLEKEVMQLIKQRDEVSIVLISPGENCEDYIDKTVDQLTEEIAKYNLALVMINDVLTKANVDASIEFNGTKYTLANALYKVKQCRQEAAKLENFGKKLPRRRENSYGNNANVVYVATYNIGAYEEYAKELKNDNDEMSKLIDEINQKYIVEIDEEKIPK